MKLYIIKSLIKMVKAEFDSATSKEIRGHKQRVFTFILYL